MFHRRLQWSAPDDFGQVEANDLPYRYIAWSNKNYGELRIIRRSNEGGIIVPIDDFSVYCRDIDSAMRLAEKINKALRKSRKYNTFKTLF
jgi:hypothetical protein